MLEPLDPLTAAALTFLPALIQRRLLDERLFGACLFGADASAVPAAATPGVAAATRVPRYADRRSATLAPADTLEIGSPSDPSHPATHSSHSRTRTRLAHAFHAAALPDTPANITLIDRAIRQADQALDDARRAGIETIIRGHADYPSLLAQIADPPFLLWRRGDPTSLHSPCLAIVGSRAASEYALLVAGRLAADLAAAGLTIVSGLARGADSAAHRGAITTGRTAAILGSGLDRLYPPEHDELAAAIVDRGGLILSEFPPGAPPRRDHFPQRNRLISGLALGVLVIEASERSGSLQTARFAAEQGREVMAVPGSILTERNRGAHGLLRDGAILVERAADVLAELRLPEPGHRATAELAGDVAAAEVTPPTQRPVQESANVLLVMRGGEAYDLQALVDASGRSPEQLLRELLVLELEGRVTKTGDGRFLRAGRPVIR